MDWWTSWRPERQREDLSLGPGETSVGRGVDLDAREGANLLFLVAQGLTDRAEDLLGIFALFDGALEL